MKLSLYKVGLQFEQGNWNTTIKYVLAADYNEAASKAKVWEEESRAEEDREKGVLNNDGDLIVGKEAAKVKMVKTIELLEEEVLI